MDHSRDPCPWVILNDFGGAFAMGVSDGFDLLTLALLIC
jgi:import inner membrane translocase subunit TIM17